MNSEQAGELYRQGKLPARYHVFGLEFDLDGDDSREYNQLEVITAIKDYCTAALNGDGGALWEALPQTWSDLGHDLKAWIQAWEPAPGLSENWSAEVKFIREGQGV